MPGEDDEKTDDILGIVRCARCGHRIEGEEECPFCSAMRGYDAQPGESGREGFSLVVYLTAMLLTFPLSLPWLLTSRRLRASQKAAFLALCAGWLLLVGSWFF